MAGAAITITVLTLAAVHTLNIPVDLPTALLLSVVASLCACGASGVAGGSLLLIPLACNMFGIPNDVAMQVVAVGFIIGVLQDSCETALNSSTDALFTAAACMAEDDQLAKTPCADNAFPPLSGGGALFLYCVFNLKRIDTALLHPAEANDVQPVDDQETAFYQRPANGTQPQIMRDPAGGGAPHHAADG